MKFSYFHVVPCLFLTVMAFSSFCQNLPPSRCVFSVEVQRPGDPGACSWMLWWTQMSPKARPLKDEGGVGTGTGDSVSLLSLVASQNH